MKTVALTLVGQRVLSPSETSNVGFTLRKLPKLINPTDEVAHNFTTLQLRRLHAATPRHTTAQKQCIAMSSVPHCQLGARKRLISLALGVHV